MMAAMPNTPVTREYGSYYQPYLKQQGKQSPICTYESTKKVTMIGMRLKKRN